MKKMAQTRGNIQTRRALQKGLIQFKIGVREFIVYRLQSHKVTSEKQAQKKVNKYHNWKVLEP